MGIELAIGALVAATSVVTGVMQYSNAKKASKERKEANAIATASQQNEAAASRRKAIREARIRRAMILQSSENTGSGSSSGALGAASVIGTNLGSNNAQSLGQTAAATGINARTQRAANYDYRGQMWGAIGGAVTSGLSAFQSPTMSDWYKENGWA